MTLYEVIYIYIMCYIYFELPRSSSRSAVAGLKREESQLLVIKHCSFNHSLSLGVSVSIAKQLEAEPATRNRYQP